MNIKNKLSSLIYAPLALALLAACSSDEDFREKTPEVKGQTLTINATNGIEANSSRTIFTDEETKVKAVWDGTDNVVIVNGTSGNVSAPANFTVTPKEDAHYATLTGTVTGLAADNVVSGYIVSDYIKAENLSISNQLVSVDYSKQKGTFDDAMAHCLQFGTATYTGGDNIPNMSFDYKTTFFELTLTFPENLSSTVQLSMSGNGLVGKSYVNTVDKAGEFNTDANIEGNINISDVNVEAGKAKVWVAMQPTTLSNVVITAVDANNNYYKFDVSGTKSANLVAGKVYAFGVIGTASTLEESLIGEGTATSPYQISTLKQLEFVRDKVNAGTYIGKYYKLMSDIEINGEWKPIGTNTKQFKGGSFDGANHTITGSYNVNVAANEGAGLFGTVSNATIKNINNMANVTVTAAALSCGTGGIVGRLLYGSTLENCSNAGTITSSEGNIGGIVGLVIISGKKAENKRTACVEACWNEGNVVSNTINTSTKGAGGVIGQLQVNTVVGVDNIIVRGCYSKSNTNISFPNATKAAMTGGVIGFTGNKITDAVEIYSCWSAASLNGGSNRNAFITGNSGVLFNLHDTWRKTGVGLCYPNNDTNVSGQNDNTDTDTPSADAITHMNTALSTAGSAYSFDANGNITKK
ncbi:hypothetical protein [Prevotella sp.]|uniref:hypothetical protein n=1 Tax=Prevotella sp. TaxID=59823 RepID=UPI0027E2C82B|nr:hypothetical protein [Prevotella sp.]